MKQQVLLVGTGDEELGALMRYLNWCDGVDVRAVSAARDAAAIARVWHLDAVVIQNEPRDMAVPDLCQALRRVGLAAPILVSIPSQAESAIIHALEAGATVALDTPIRAGELLARLRSSENGHHRRLGAPVVLGATIFDPRRRILGTGRSSISLTETETKILTILSQAPAHGVFKEDIARAIWGATNNAALARVKCRIYRLRRKAGDTLRILRIHRGYRLKF